MAWLSARAIVEEDNVAREADRLRREYERFDEQYEAIKWLLARSCHELEVLAREVNGVLYRLYRIGGDEVAGTSDVTVLFTYDDNEVHLLGLKAEEIESSED